nr:unnamed protein product [Callosobruchus analis]
MMMACMNLVLRMDRWIDYFQEMSCRLICSSCLKQITYMTRKFRCVLRQICHQKFLVKVS